MSAPIEIAKLHRQEILLKKWNKTDTNWVLGLFATAIGAGVLFLPINAGINGTWPLLLITILAFPITFYSHRALARFIASSTDPAAGINGAIKEHFGMQTYKVFTVIYFFAIYSVLLMYSVALTNTIQEFWVQQLHLPVPSRALIALLIILSLMIIMRLEQAFILRILGLFVYPFIATLVFMSLYLIPHWNFALLDLSHLSTAKTGQEFLASLWLVFPVFVLSFNHYPIISSFVVEQRKRYGDIEADNKCAQIQKYSYLLMLLTVLFFIYSCVLTLTPADFAQAKEENISVLSYLANHLNVPLIAYLAPIVAIIAISKSFLAVNIAAVEALRDLISDTCRRRGKFLSDKKIKWTIFLFMSSTCWFIAYVNPSIMGMIESIGGPLGAIILFLLPMYGIRKIASLAPYRGKASNVFITIVGVITVAATFYALF